VAIMTDLFGDGPRARGRVLVAAVDGDVPPGEVGRLARQLRDAGFEAIYAPTGQSPAMLVAAATDEDVDALVLALGDDPDDGERRARTSVAAEEAALDAAARAAGVTLRVVALRPGEPVDVGFLLQDRAAP
jgi:hypothetical protein